MACRYSGLSRAAPERGLQVEGPTAVDFSGASPTCHRPIPTAMTPDRRMPVRIVPLTSREAADAYVEGTIDERLALLASLSRRAWAATGRPSANYTRATIPVVITRLVDQ